MASPIVTPAPAKQSWFKRVFSEIGSILKVVLKDEPKIQASITPALEEMFPQWQTLIAGGDALATKIMKQIGVTQAVGAAIAGAPTSGGALAAAIAGVEPEIDQWTANLLPGSAPLSNVAKSGIVQAFYNAFLELDPGAAPATIPAPSTPAPVTNH